MAARGAAVTGIDLAEKPLKVAQLHLLESGLEVDYRLVAPEALAREAAESFDIVTCMEMLEHVPDPGATVAACAALLKPGGRAFFSTINRNLKSYLFAIVGAEYVLKLLPRGTHDYARFIKPSELASFLRAARLQMGGITGMSYNPLTRAYSLGSNTDVNYVVHAIR
jgi:2-polyprenyl-6-hydroxyphenyl methylase/3-demethylubiquinone-9 3-methyltransferase